MPVDPPPSPPLAQTSHTPAEAALSLLTDLEGIAVDLDDPRTQRAVDDALRAACERAASWL